MSEFSPLSVTGLTLSGTHLIEASAGTGKTYNITRLYLRILLEKKLSVQQILVMTYTNAATEEIRGRIADTLREAQSFWQACHSCEDAGGDISSVDGDPDFHVLYQRTPGESGLALIKAALLELDDAAVFTIHGFCNRVLSQLAFSSGSSMTLTLDNDTHALYLTAASDYLRSISQQKEKFTLLASRGWQIPDALLHKFMGAIAHNGQLVIPQAGEIETKFAEKKAQILSEFETAFEEVRNHLSANKAFLFDALVNIKKGKDKASREAEWESIEAWLNTAQPVEPEKAVFDFCSRRRTTRNLEARDIMEPLNQLCDKAKSWEAQLEQEKATALNEAALYAVVEEAISFIRQHVEKSKTHLGTINFDDMISLLANRITSPDCELSRRLRALFPVGLIDEFQDTDMQQYHIISNMYPSSQEDTLLMMIGDPKQAIYGFRGGDIFTYLEAGRRATYRWNLGTNWRSTSDMVDAYNRLFYGAPLNQEKSDVFGFGIDYHPVASTPYAKAAKFPLSDSNSDKKALHYAVLKENDDGKSIAKGLAAFHMSIWICGEIQRLLSQAKLGDTPVKPGDIAILVRGGGEASLLQNQLAKAGLSAVYMSNKSSLYESAEAHDLLRVLTGIWQQETMGALTPALGSPLFGLSQETLTSLLYDEDDQAWESTMETVRTLKEMWSKRGVMSVILSLLENHYVQVGDTAERALTNYLHLAESLEKAASRQPHPNQLLLWFARQLVDQSNNDESVQRLESDANLIQIITQHKSKGLEYPIVFVPFATHYKDPAKYGNTLSDVHRYYSDKYAQQVVQVGSTDDALTRVREQGEAEAMRLLYVAITRASHRCYVGMMPTDDASQSAIAQALTGREGGDHIRALEQIIEQTPQHTSVEWVDASWDVSPKHNDIETTTPNLNISVFEGEIYDDWRLYSFTALTRQSKVVKRTHREAEVDEAVISEEQNTAELPFRFSFAKGAASGNLLHDVLEVIDFSEPDWEGEAQTAMKKHGLAEDNQPAFIAWLEEVLQTPLETGDQSAYALQDLAQAHTLREAEFYFPMNTARSFALTKVLQHHRQSLKRDTTSTLPAPTLSSHTLSGMMHGFIDLIFYRDGKYYVADYKSTHLGDNAESYHPEALQFSNQHHLYDLQYLIYSLALHRYLQRHVPDYDFDCHFGGVYYFYLRGMSPDFPTHSGVYFCQLPQLLVEQLDAVFTDDVEVME